jgi:hypothetical protein
MSQQDRQLCTSEQTRKFAWSKIIVGGKQKEEIAAGIKPSFNQSIQIKGLAMRVKRTAWNPLGEEDLNALDNFRGLACVVVTWALHDLYSKLIHQHLAGPGGCYPPDPGHSGPKDAWMITETKR